jgi:hypothetical protein
MVDERVLFAYLYGSFPDSGEGNDIENILEGRGRP